MNDDLRNMRFLDGDSAFAHLRRPLIGVPMGRERSARMHGLPLYIMNQTYVRVLERVGALPVLIPLGMSEATLRGTFERLDGRRDLIEAIGGGYQFQVELIRRWFAR